MPERRGAAGADPVVAAVVGLVLLDEALAELSMPLSIAPKAWSDWSKYASDFTRMLRATA